MAHLADPEVQAMLALRLIEGLGPVRIEALVTRFGSARQVLHASAGQLAQVSGIGANLSAQVAEALRQVDVAGEVSRMGEAGVGVLLRGEPDYPSALAAIPQAPPVLYVRGEVRAADARAVALVGTRHPTAQGRKVAQRLAEGLARAGVVVVSGLARGIDGVAHQGALTGGGRTIAVLAGGLARLYPPEHRGLAERVVGAGALVCESPMLQEPVAGLFPARNRIISGLSRVVVIVQAAIKSGALITADHAAEQGRTVMAVPGSVDDEEHGGCHKLIRDGAVLCRGVDDILEELDGVSVVAQRARAAQQEVEPSAPRPATRAGPPPGLDEVQRRAWEFLAAGARSVDELAQGLGLGVPALSGVLLALEMRRVVRRLPGSRYERC
jgi:DNA processing protein